MQEPNNSVCEFAYQLAYHPIYRAAQLWSLLASLISIPAMIYFILRKILFLRFHGNLKCLLMVYFICNLLYSMVICFAFFYHFFVPFFITSKCQLIIDNTLLKWGQIWAMILMTCSMLIPVGFSIERFVALGRAKHYEKTQVLLGPVIVAIIIAIDFSIIFAVYKDEPFTDQFYSFIILPSSSAMQLTTYFCALLFLKILNLFLNCILLRIHKKIKIKCYTLTLRYEMEEILQSSKFTFIISFAHLLLFGFSVTVTIFVRTMGESFFNGDLNYAVARGVYCSFPTYSLIIVFIGIKSLRHLSSQRLNRVQSTVQIASTGREGSKNYENVISNYWDSVSTKNHRIK